MSVVKNKDIQQVCDIVSKYSERDALTLLHCVEMQVRGEPTGLWPESLEDHLESLRLKHHRQVSFEETKALFEGRHR